MPANHARVLVTQKVDDAKRIRLLGNVRPEALAANDRGRVADNFVLDHIFLQLRRSPEQEQAVEQYIDSLQKRGSPDFHHWLSADEFGARFGLADADLGAVKAWLSGHGLQINFVYQNRLLIDFSGTASQVRQAFGTEIHKLDVNGQQHFANMSDPQIPEALAAAVIGPVSLNDFRPKAMHRAKPAYTYSGCGGKCQAVVPADLATIYNLNPLFQAGITGKGQSVVVVEDTNLTSNADWTSFRSKFGLTSYSSGSLTTVHPAPPVGKNNCTSPGVNGDESEAALDAQWASAAAPNAAIVLASCGNTSSTFGGLIALQNLLNSASPPAIVSISYGECEVLNGAAANATYALAYQQAVAAGVSVFVSSGDEGAASCDANQSTASHGIGVSGFTSTPYNVSVGGTDFGDTYAHTTSNYWYGVNTSTFGSARSYVPEIPWNDSCASVLLAQFTAHSPITYGKTGFCSVASGKSFLTTASGSGGPSGCATGAAASKTKGVVSGTCAGYPKPAWQHGVVGIPADGVRDIPDVSLFAANGVWGHYYVFCYSNRKYQGTSCSGAPSGWSGAGGTSFGSPIMAAIQALVNQRTGRRQGNPNPIYYQLAAAEYGGSGNPACNSSNGNTADPSCVFYDVTLGDMDVNCKASSPNCYLSNGKNGVLSTSTSSYQPAYGTSVGWDFATGIGTFNGANLVNNPAWPTSP